MNGPTAEKDAQVVLGQIGEHVDPQACRECGKSASACGRSRYFCCAACSQSRFGTHDARVTQARRVRQGRAHVVAPPSPKDGDRFTCEPCNYVAEFVVLDDGRPGEWVDVLPPGSAASEGNADA